MVRRFRFSVSSVLLQCSSLVFEVPGRPSGCGQGRTGPFGAAAV